MVLAGVDVAWLTVVCITKMVFADWGSRLYDLEMGQSCSLPALCWFDGDATGACSVGRL